MTECISAVEDRRGGWSGQCEGSWVMGLCLSVTPSPANDSLALPSHHHLLCSLEASLCSHHPHRSQIREGWTVLFFWPSSRLGMSVSTGPPPAHPHPQPAAAAPVTVGQLQFELSEAGKLYSACRQQNDLLKAAYNDLQSSHTALQTRVTALTTSLQSSLTTQRSLEADYQQRYLQYTATLQAKDAELSTLLSTHLPPSQIDVLRADIAEEVTTTWRERMRTLQAQWMDCRREVAAGEKERAIMQVEYEGTVNLLKSLHSHQCDDLSAQLLSAKAALTALTPQGVDPVALQLEGAQREVAALTLRLRHSVEDVGVVRDQLERGEEAQRLRESEWERERAALLTRGVVGERQVELARVREEELQGEVTRLRREVVELQGKRGEWEERVRDLREEGKVREGEVAALRDAYDKKQREREAAEEERDRSHRALCDELYEQVRRLQGEKDDLRRRVQEGQEALGKAVKRREEEKRGGGEEKREVAPAAVGVGVDPQVGELRGALQEAQRQVRAVIEDRQRVVQRWEEMALERERERKEAGERQVEYAGLQSSYREVREREMSGRERVEGLTLQVGLLQREVEEVRREREEERRMLIASKEQQQAAWRQEKMVLLQRLAKTEGGSGGGGEGKYKAMCVGMRDKLSLLMREMERERVDFHQQLQLKAMEVEEMQHRLTDSDRLRVEVTRLRSLPTPS